ncbi:carbamoyltransferase C-terminal domain-containing protein [Streptomyces sp. NPDC059096]|uniref:carbamoyltransferase C-terminal domain-containing protein n=1 Tax=Streptomyces sp. NPDC059096 TaxID=3346727 RepID=UPI00369EF266
MVELLLAEKVGAVVEGRAEVGPRALGHRSIIALPRHAKMRETVNTVKSREQWRPFAPITLESYAPRLWPSQGLRERYMVGSSAVSSHAHEVMPAAIHVDGTTRPQVLKTGQASVLEGVLRTMESNGEPPVLINTSFNGRGEPIVESAADAARTFRELDLDFLVMGGLLVTRPEKSRG